MISKAMSVPFLDLVTPHRELKEELLEVFENALGTAGFVGGPMVDSFERQFAAFCGTTYCVGVGSGTDALRFALLAAGVGPGDIVLTVPNTFIATTEAISQAGARPDFVDVDEHTYTLDPRKFLEYIGNKCKFDHGRGVLIHAATGAVVRAVIPVHLYGQMADMDAIEHLASSYNIIAMEDACQAHGARYYSHHDVRWKMAGAMGAAAAFSFYPGKNLGACGEAGAVTTNDEQLARRMRMLRDHGQAEKYYHEMEGYNGRLDAIQAGILSVKLNHLQQWNEQRREAAAAYRELLSDIRALELPTEPAYAEPVYHQFVVQTEDRDDVRAKLQELGVSTGIHYPIPLHLQKAYAHLGFHEGDFPVAERVARRAISLPMYPSLTRTEQARVREAIIACLQPGRASRAQIA